MLFLGLRPGHSQHHPGKGYKKTAISLNAGNIIAPICHIGGLNS